MKIPSVLTSGDSVSWDDDPSSDNLGNPVDSSSWTLKYDFRQQGVANISVTASAQVTGWRTSLTAAQSGLWAAGVVYWQAYAVKGSDRVTLGAGQLTIAQDVAGSSADGAGEFRSQTEQDLAAVQGAIRAIITGGAVAEYSIGGRSLRKIPLNDLTAYEGILKARLFREQKAQRIANGLGNPSNIYIRFKG